MKKLILILIFPFIAFSQNNEEPISNYGNTEVSDYTSINDSLKRFSVGLKLGIPNIASLGLQYTLPVLENHIAPYIDFSRYSFNEMDVESNLSFSEFGLSYYIDKKGKGSYIGLGFSNLSLDVNFLNIDLDSGGIGSGKSSVDLKTTNLKFGIKTGGRIYFRFEVGYGFGDLPQTVSFTAIDNSNPTLKETTVEDIPNIPGVSENGLLVGNFGFGISF